MTRVPTRKPFITKRAINRDLLASRLGARRAFELASAQLYQLVLGRVRGQPESVNHLAERLGDFEKQERRHAEMLEALLRQLGRDPDELSPSADLALREADPLLALCRDPAQPLDLLLHALHAAEVLDSAGWELLIDLGKAADLDEEWLRSFRAAGREEKEHLHQLRTFVELLDRNQLERPRPIFPPPA